MSERVITFIMAAYNAASTIASAIDSLVGQTSPHWRLLVVDDGSKDDTARIAGEYAGRDSRITVVTQPNGGASAARNTGFSMVETSHVGFLDADDLVDPTYVDRMLDAFTRQPTPDVAYCQYRRFSPDGQMLNIVDVPDLERDPVHTYAGECVTVIHGIVFRRSLLDEVGTFDPALRTCEDWDLWMRFARNGARFAYVPACLAFYRQSPGSLTRGVERLIRDTYTVFERFRSRDPRVPNPVPGTENGVPVDTARSVLASICWCAGQLAGKGEPCAHLLDLLPDMPEMWEQESTVVASVVNAVMDGIGTTDFDVLRARMDVWVDPIHDLFRRIGERSDPACYRRLISHLAFFLLWQKPEHGRVDVGPILAAVVDPDDLTTLRLRDGQDTFQFWIRWGKHADYVGEFPVYGDIDPATKVEIMRQCGRLKALRRGPHIRRTAFWSHVARGAPGTVRRMLRNRASWRRHLGVLANEASAKAALVAKPADDAAAHPAVAARMIDEARRSAAANPPPVAPVAGQPVVPSLPAQPAAETTDRIPVLMYHRIADHGPEAVRRYRTSPAAFEEQMRYLRQAGYEPYTSDRLAPHLARRTPFRGKAVLLTFDDGFCDFEDAAAPIMERHGMTGEVFIVTERVGRTSDWDAKVGGDFPLMTWDSIRRLQGRGFAFGSHLQTHRAACLLSSHELLREAAGSRFTLETQLGREIRSIALPFGAHDPRTEWVLADAGYHLNYFAMGGVAPVQAHHMKIPRVEVYEGMSIDAFAAALRGEELPASASLQAA